MWCRSLHRQRYNGPLGLETGLDADKARALSAYTVKQLRLGVLGTMDVV